MHELALSQSIVELVLERAAAERLRTVTRVVVEVGAAAGVDPEALRFCFEAVTEETAATRRRAGHHEGAATGSLPDLSP